MSDLFRLATRGSPLALAQSRWVAARMEETSSVRVEIEVIQTRGDRILDRPLPEIGGKGLFTEALDRALLEEQVDLAVHSLKDLPTEPVEGLHLACIPEREDPSDVLVGPGAQPVFLATLPVGAVVGTSSLRRKALLGAFRPDLQVRDVRGNLGTRLGKLDDGHYDALVLAAAGLKRLGLAHRVGEWLDRTAWLPAPGQGALAIVTRSGDRRTEGALRRLHDAGTAGEVEAERALLSRMGGGCHLPVGALAMGFGSGLRLRGMVVSPDGRQVVKADLTGVNEEPGALGMRLAELLLARGAEELLRGIPDPAGAPAGA